ncbi:hypothetical protein [Kribbella sp. CA-293567]|uniref:hypothetical protein n=1 Tax=Kribbella sp. CA-293567 TaxID=3002436 RepID=UPI0022DCEADA|nr:hypothetical protein [Kribbella sp. CA-293567]WBQ05119.1 hypothetical protein OX958_34875 [Kribbella sp. CA-293567]
MPRPGDWDSIGLGGDPTPGDPERISALAEGFQKMGGKAREILTAIEAVMNKNDDSVFVGETAEALRGKVDGRLRGHVEDVAAAFETSATALREWRGVVVEQQAKADAALNAGRGLAEDDPERETQKNAAKAAGDYQSEQASTYAGRINGVADIQLPISECDAFWEAFKWLAIILIIPALIFGGPIALLALAVNLAIFIKTIVDVAKGDAGFLDLFLAGLGLIAPTTKALPIFSIVKAVGSGIGAGVRSIAQTFRQVFSKDFLVNGLLAGLKSMPALANIAIRETGLFVVKNIRNFPVNAANFGNNFGKVALNGIRGLGTGFANLPGTVFRGLGTIGKGIATGAVNTWKFTAAHFGGMQWTRIFLPVAANEIRAFRALGMGHWQSFTSALKVGVVGRGLQGTNVFGMPTVAAVGRGIGAVPIDTAAAGGGWSKFVTELKTPEIRIPLINVKGFEGAAGAGFNAGHAFTAIDDININLGAVKNGDLGISVSPPTTVTPTGLHLPANAGTNIPTSPIATNIPSPHIGAPQMPSNVVGNLVQPQVGTPVLPVHLATGATPPPVHVNAPTMNANGLIADIPSPQLGTPQFNASASFTNVNVQAPGLNNIGSLHVPTPSATSAGLSDLANSAIRNNQPTVSPNFGNLIGDGVTNGFQANHFKVSIDEILNTPTTANFNGLQALNPPAVDRINAALDLVHNPGATSQGVTPPAIHTAKPAGTDVNVNVNLAGADFKTPAPTTIKVDNPGLAGAQNTPTVPTVNIQQVALPNRAVDLHVQPANVHANGQGVTNLPSTNLPTTNLAGTNLPGGTNLASTNLPGPNLPGAANLAGTNLPAPNLPGAANLAGTNLPAPNLPGATNLAGTNLPAPNLPGAANLTTPPLPGGTNLASNVPPTNLAGSLPGGTTIPGNVGVPGHGVNPHASAIPEQLVPVHPQPAPAANNLGTQSLNTPTLNTNLGAHNPGFRDPGYTLAKGADIGNSGIGTNTLASKVDIPLNGLTDRPGAYVRVERTEGGMTSYNLYGGGPDGRMDVLAGGNLRFTDTATGQTTRFDSSGLVLDQGLRLTRTDGVLRPADQILVSRPGGEFRVTSLTGEIAPDVKIRRLDNGGVQLTDPKGTSFHYNAQGKLDHQPLSAAWDADLAAKAGVFRKPGDTDAMVSTKMADFAPVQRAQTHFDNALDNVAVHGHRADGPSTGPAVGDQVHLDLRAAEADLNNAKTAFESKHGLDADGIQQQLDKLTLDSLKERPRLLGGVSKSFDLPGGGGMKFELNGGQVTFSGPKADAFSSSLDGKILTITELGAGGKVAHNWTYSLGFGGRANQIGESFPLNGGMFDGRPISLEGRMGSFDQALVTDLRGNKLPVKLTDDGFVVASPNGPLVYDRSGSFHGGAPAIAGDLPKPVPPANLTDDALTRWNAQADISRTHLTAAAQNRNLDLLMKDVAGGSFTSKKGFEGYVNPQSLKDGTLVSKVHTFDTMAKDLAFKGPEDSITVYRGVSMDPGSAKAGAFTERLPISTSASMKFQDEWAKNGVNSNRVVFEIDVPPGHSKLAMSYPEGYKPVKGDAPEVNASQFEVTLSPTTLVRTGPNRTLDNGVTVIPVQARQIPPSSYHDVINAKWPGLSSETAFGDFVKSFELTALRQFPDLENVAAKSVLSTDGLTHTTTVSKPGFRDELTITVMRDPKADSVRVTVASDGVNKFDQTWSKTDFKHLATDLRGGVLHNNEQFMNLPQPWQWQKAEPFRGEGVSDAQVLQRMDDWTGVEKAQLELDSIKRDFGPQTGRVDGSSNAPSVGDQAKLELQLAEQQLVEAKAVFTQLHNLDADATADWLQMLRTLDLQSHPGLLGGTGRPGRGIDLPGADGVQLVRDGRAFTLAGDGAGSFRLQTGADGNMLVQKLGADDLVLHSWTLKPGFRPSVIGETLTLGDGPLAGKFLDLQGTAGKLDGIVDDVRGGMPVKASGDEIVVARPDGVFKYDRDGFFQGPVAHPGDQLGRPVLPAGLTGENAARWTAQADLSRTHLGEAGSNKAVENLMKDVAGGSFTSKKGYGGFVNPSALADGTLLGKMQNFHSVTQDLLTKGPADNITLYRGVSMDPAAAKADLFTERLPLSTSSTVKFQDEWAKNGVNSNRVVFEIDVPPGHNKLSMSYPDGYKPGAGEAKAWNQDQFEVTLAPTNLVRTGPSRTLDNGITVIPVRAELIPPSAYNDVITQKWPGLSSATAFDDFAKSFELTALRQFPDLQNVTSKSVLSSDGLVNRITVGKPGAQGNDMHITVTRDPQADSVRVTVEADGLTKFDKSWSGPQFSDLATDLRGGVLHNNEQFINLPQPAAWADDVVESAPLDLKGKGKQADLGTAWEDDLAAKTNVFRKPGESDAVVHARMDDFRQVQQAQLNVDRSLQDLAEHGHRFDGTSSDLPVGIQMRIQLGQAEADLSLAKSSFQAKHGMEPDGLQQQLDDLLQQSLKDRPRLPGGAPSQFPVPEGGAMFKLDGTSVSFNGARADAFEGVLDGRALRITETNADGAVVRTLDYELNARNFPILKSDELTLNGGAFDGQRLRTDVDTGRPSNGSTFDAHGNELPTRYYQDNFQVPSSAGAQVYDRGGNFLHIEKTLTGKLAEPVPPMHLAGDDLARWTAQADLSRTHLTAAAKYDHVSDMMVKIREGAFTSKRGFDGYVDPLAQSRQLTNDVRSFNEVAKDVLFDGPVGNTTVYRGVAMDPASAKGSSFVERLPASTSSNWEFQKTWAKDADLTKRVVFQIDVPPGHGKLSMSYPDGYKPGLNEAKAWNQGQFEVTLSPTVLQRTGDSFVQDGMTVIPVRATQIPESRLDALIGAKWPGMSSAAAFDDFARGFDQANLRKFPGMADVTATSKVTDDLVNEIVVSKPGLSGHDLTIRVSRDVDADAVRVTVTADGKTSFNHSWSKEQFGNIATDLKAGTLHDHDLFVSMSKPAAWNKQPLSADWNAELAAQAKVFRQAGDSEATIAVKMEDFSRIRQNEYNLKQAELNAGLHGGRPDGGSSGGGISVGDQVRLDLHAAQADLDVSKLGFKRKYSMDPDQLMDDLGQVAKKPKLPGAGRQFEVPGGGVSYQVENGTVQFTGTRAGEFSGSVSGREITVTQLAANGDTAATWTFRQGFGRPNLTGHTIHLADGPLAGEVANLKGMAGQLDGTLHDGGVWPMKVVGDELFVATPGGPLRYGRDGSFHGPAPTSTAHLPAPVLPANIHGNPVHWTNQVDLSRTHLTAAAENKAVENLMKDVMGGSFTSKRGFEGYVNPLALADGTLIGKAKNFADVTSDLRLRGPDADVTLYRGVSMDPVSARADEFVDRLPSSTSNNIKFQEEWARNGVASNRFVFEIEVPAGHGKLAMSYPPGYQALPDEARAWNQSQWEVTLAPTTLQRTGPNRVENGMTIIPVRAEQIPVSSYESLITAKWPGMSSESAFADFAKSFELDNLRKFTGLETVTSKSVLSTDGLTNTITVSKAGYADDLTITVLRDADADSVRVTVAADGVTSFDKTWSRTDFKHIAADLRGNVLHNSDLLAGRMEPASWKGAPATKSMSEVWEADSLARIDVLRKAGDTDAALTVRIDDFTSVQKAQNDYRAALARYDELGARPDGPSSGLSVGHQARIDLQTAQHNLDVAKQAFDAKHGVQFDGLQQQLDDLLTTSIAERPRLVGGGSAWSSPQPPAGHQVTVGNRTSHFDGQGQLVEEHFGLAGAPDRFVVRQPDGGLELIGDGADDFVVRALDDGGFRVYGADGQAQRYGADGIHLGDGRSVVDGNGLRGDRFVEVDLVNGHRLVDLQGNQVPGQTVDLLPGNGFRVTDGNRSFGYDAAGVRVDAQLHLTGVNNGHALVHPVGGQPHLTGPNAQHLQVQDLPGGSFRVNDAQGNSQRYGPDGVRVNDGLAVVDAQGLQPVRFVEPNPAGGVRLVDATGTPIPNTHTTQLPNGQTMVVDDGLNDVQWFGQNGVRQGTGVQVAHADFPNGQVYLFRAEGGNVSFVDNLGAQLPHQVDVLPGGGFRLTDPGNGIARTFDDAGLAIDRRIPLHQPGIQPNQQLIAVHDVHGNVSLVTRADAPGPGTIELIGNGGYRAVDGGNYRVYDADGAHQAHGVAVTLHGEQGFLEIGAQGAQRVDGAYQPIPGRQPVVNAAAGEITVPRPGGHDVFDLHGVPVRQVTDLDPLGAGQLGGRVTHDQNGIATWTDLHGTAMPTPHRVTVDAQGNARIEVHVAGGSPRNGEYHQYNRAGNLTEQGFPVLDNGRPTPYQYVVDRANSTWTRTGGTGPADGVFQTGKLEVTGVGNGQLKLVSSSAKEVQVFERRWLPGGEILDSFRKTDTLNFGTFNRRTTWATYDNAGGISNWGKREFDTSGFSWRDVDHNGRQVHHYQQGLQKYDNPIAEQIGPMGKAEKEITGHVLATRGAGDNWTWHRFDADGALVGSGQRTWEKVGDGFTDRVTLQVNGTNTTEIAQQKWGTWNKVDNANQYQEFKLENGAAGLERPGSWEIQGKAGKPVGSGTKLFNDDILSAHRVGEQRPPVWFRDYIQRNPVPEGNVSHVANDARYQIYRWENTGTNNPGHGVRYVGGDESIVDVGLDGRFVRFEGKLHDGTTLKVGNHVEPPTTAHPSTNAQLPWEAGDAKGWRVFDDTSNSWQDFRQLPGPYRQGETPAFTLVRQSMPGGEVREFPELRNNHVWVQRDAHGNLVGSSHQLPAHGPNPPVRYVEATGPADGSRWVWRELDANGTPTGPGGERFHFKGSRDESISWDNSFRDFDAGGNLVRDRHLLDEGRYVESWKSGQNWHSAEFDKFGQRVDAAVTFDRRWSNATGAWAPDWSRGSTHFRDVTPNAAPVPHQVRFETPQHLGDGQPVRVREYHVNAAGNSDQAQWKEFDFDKIVRERAASGTNYLETDKLHGQWKIWDTNGRVVGERSDTGLVFELRDGRLTLTGNEFDFRGAMTEFRGWNARIGDAQRQPWHLHSDWTLDAKTLRPGGDPLRIESNYVSYSRLLTQKMFLTAGTEFMLDYAASLIIMAIIAEAQNRPFNGTDALKALMNAAVGTTLRTAAGTALTETRLGGGLRDLKTTMGNLDGGTLITKRPNNNSSQWGVEFAGNTSVTKWRAGTFDYGLGMMLLPLTAFVNGTMNAAIFGVKGPDGKTVQLTGWQALAEGGMAAATGYAIANSIGMLRTIGMGFGAGRFFQKGGVGELGIGFGLKFFEKGMASLLAPALRASMNPEWSRPAPQPQPAPTPVVTPPSVTVPQPQVTSGGVILPPGVQAPQPSAPTGAP